MKDEKRSLSGETLEPAYLELLANLGMTRHLGGVGATDKLVKLCQIGQGKYILDVGCGIGKTACRLAKQLDCRLVGVDISPRMVEWSKERARKEGVEDRAEFRTADAQDLPFEDNTFDAVFNESILSFIPDRQKALIEYIRVTKPGGYVGLNETTWIETPVPKELQEALSGNFFSGAKLETVEEWKELLAESGLKDIIVKTFEMTARSDVLDRLKWFGFWGIIRNIYHMIFFARQSPANRKVMKRLIKLQRNMPKDFYKYYGYGLYVGRK